MIQAITKTILSVIMFSLLFACSSPSYVLKDGQWQYEYSTSGGKMVNTIDQADHASFTVLKHRYAKDKNHVYFKGTVIDTANPHTFEFIANTTDGMYAKDGKSVFFDANRLYKADPTSFRLLQTPYAKDQHRLYNGSLPIIGIEKPLNIDTLDINVIKPARPQSGASTSGFVHFHPQYSALLSGSIRSVKYSRHAQIRINGVLWEGVKPLSEQ